TTVRLWRAATGEELLRYEVPDTRLDKGQARAQDYEIRQVAISPDGSQVAAGDARGMTTLWHIASGSSLLTMEGMPGKDHTLRYSQGEIRGLAFDPDSSTVLAAFGDGSIRRCQGFKKTPPPLATFGTGSNPITGLAIAPDGRTVAVANSGTLTLWD